MVVLIVVGPNNLPQFARSAGRLYGQIRRTAEEMRRALVLEADRQDAEKRYQEMLERRRRAEEERQKALEANPGATPQDEAFPAAADPAHHEADDPHAPFDDPHAPFDDPHAPPGSSSASGDADLDALIHDPHGPYAAGTSAQDLLERRAAATPAPSATGAPPSAAADTMTGEALPPGVTAQEWAELPPHIRDLLRERTRGGTT